MGGSRGHDNPALSSRLRQLQEKVPLLYELAELDRRLNGPDGWRVYADLLGGSSNSMLLTTREIAEGTPQRWELHMGSRKIVELTPEQQQAAIRKESEEFESEFYMLGYKGPVPGIMETQRQG